MGNAVHMNPVEAGMIFLIESEPLYALTLLEFDRITTTGDTPFAMVGRDGSGKLGLYTNNEELSKWNRIQIGYVFAHELLHIILRHLERHPAHSELWNIAEDLSINDMLREEDMTKLFGEKMMLPGCFPGEGRFISLPRRKTADEYYEMLVQQGFTAKKKSKWVITVTGKDGKSVDIKISGTQRLSKEDKKQIEEIIKEAVKKAHGKMSGKLTEHINNFLKDRIDWARIMANMVGSVRSIKRRSIYKFSRKYDDQAGSRRTKKLAIVAIRDTSGSVPDEAIQRFNGVFENLKRIGGTVYVMDCDTEVDNRYWLKSKFQTLKTKSEVKGRGGTSFIPPFQLIRKERIEADVVVYLTDLEGSFPTGRDIFKNTIWCTITDHPIPFGKKVLIPKD